MIMVSPDGEREKYMGGNALVPSPLLVEAVHMFKQQSMGESHVK